MLVHMGFPRAHFLLLPTLFEGKKNKQQTQKVQINHLKHPLLQFPETKFSLICPPISFDWGRGRKTRNVKVERTVV
jgi:hypothetical protein